MFFAPSASRLRPYPVGWYGDNGFGESMIQKIVSGRKTATLGPAYDPEERRVGECVELVDKTGKARAVIRITGVEFLSWRDLDQSHAARLGLSLEEIREHLPRYIAREIRPDEELRLTCFELVR